MSRNLTVPLWIIVLIVALPQLSETIYTPSLPALAASYDVSDKIAQYTLTVFLIGFAFGVLGWGRFSDRYGRKPGLYLGLILYMLASIGCYMSTNIEFLLFMRFLQAIGASVGSVLGQAIARDAIKPEDRGRAFSTVSMAMAFAPALGPVIGGLIINYTNWNMVFIMLFVLAAFIFIQVASFLPETNPTIGVDSDRPSFLTCFKKMSKDPHVLGFGCLVGGVNGILFGYFAEAPFFFIDTLSLSPSLFGMSAFWICLPLALGGMISKSMHNKNYSSNQIIFYGLWGIIFSSLFFFGLTYSGMISVNNKTIAVLISLLFINATMVSITMIVPNCLSQALQNYGNFAGTAASLFGFYYYLLISAMTSLMSYLHNGSLYALPFYMLILGAGMMLVFRTTIYSDKKEEILKA